MEYAATQSEVPWLVFEMLRRSCHAPDTFRSSTGKTLEQLVTEKRTTCFASAPRQAVSVGAVAFSFGETRNMPSCAKSADSTLAGLVG